MTPNLMSFHALTPIMPLPKTGIVGKMPIGKSAFEKNARRQNFDFFKCFWFFKWPSSCHFQSLWCNRSNRSNRRRTSSRFPSTSCRRTCRLRSSTSLTSANAAAATCRQRGKNFISLSVMKRQRKLECLPQASLSSLVYYLWIRPEYIS